MDCCERSGIAEGTEKQALSLCGCGLLRKGGIVQQCPQSMLLFPALQIPEGIAVGPWLSSVILVAAGSLIRFTMQQDTFAWKT